MSKKSQHPIYDDPTAFKKQFPLIREATDDYATSMKSLGEVKVYKMGKVRAIVTLTPIGYHFAVHGKDCYPSWDEIVWLRYNLIPDAAVMALLLPNLDSYINQDDNNYKFVFTAEQTEWRVVSLPECPHCRKKTTLHYTGYAAGFAQCNECFSEDKIEIDLTNWNERHGSGLHAYHFQAAHQK